jgi:predicted nucleotidyltransferase
MPRKEDIAQHVAERLSRIHGVVAVVLGGSLARGSASADSDIDVGIYYRAARPPAVAELREAAKELTQRAHVEVADFGEWGPWVNGGAWLDIGGEKVDWLYRELEKVERVISDCISGVVSCDYYLGHPHGFHNHIYMAEVHYCRPLSDPQRVLDGLKQRTRPYPEALKRAIVNRYLYDGSFMLELTTKPAARGDVFHVSGCLFRCAAALVQVLFALNERYFMNEKGSLHEIEALDRHPPSFASRLAEILGTPGSDAGSLQTSCREMANLIAETRALASGAA